MSHSFPKHSKLCGQLRIAQLYKEGTRFTAWPLRVTWKPISNDQSPGASFRRNGRSGLRRERYNHQSPMSNQILIWAPKSLFKRAVQRNRLRRLMREAYRLHQDILQSEGRSFSRAVEQPEGWSVNRFQLHGQGRTILRCH